MAGLKKLNEYSQSYPNYDITPKSVIAAVAYSLAMRLCNDNFDEAELLIRDEWDAFNKCGIVPQKPK